MQRHETQTKSFSKLLLSAAAGAGLLGLAALSAGATSAGNPVDPRVVLEFVGSDVGELRDVDGIQMMCFDGDLVDIRTGSVIGSGTDCLDLGSIEEGDPFAGDPFVIQNVTYFNLPQGQIVAEGVVTASPVLQGSSGELEEDVTHITGNFSRGSIRSASGAFEGLQADVRLQGAVDMSQFDGLEGSPIDFNCVFLFDPAN